MSIQSTSTLILDPNWPFNRTRFLPSSATKECVVDDVPQGQHPLLRHSEQDDHKIEIMPCPILVDKVPSQKAVPVPGPTHEEGWDLGYIPLSKSTWGKPPLSNIRQVPSVAST